MSESMHRPDLFPHVMNNLRYGAAAEELNDALALAVKTAQDTGKTSVLKLEIKIIPKANSGQYFIEDKIETKLPKLPKESTIFFGTSEGNLQRDDLRQTKMEFRDASAARTIVETRDVGAEAGKVAVKAV